MQPCTDVVALCWIEAHPGLASWLQAIFSVLAILVAIALPSFHDARRRRARQRRLQSAVCSAVNGARILGNLFLDVMQKPTRVKGVTRVRALPTISFEHAKADLAGLPLLELESSLLATRVRTFHSMFCNLEDTYTHLLERDENYAGVSSWAALVKDKVQEIHRQADLIIDQCSELSTKDRVAQVLYFRQAKP